MPFRKSRSLVKLARGLASRCIERQVWQAAARSKSSRFLNLKLKTSGQFELNRCGNRLIENLERDVDVFPG